MPVQKSFTTEAEGKLFAFLKNYREYVQKQVESVEDSHNCYNLHKLKNYIHNIILRRAGLETTTACYGSRVIGTSIFLSNLNLYVDAGKWGKISFWIFLKAKIFADRQGNVSEKDHAIAVLKKVRKTMTRCKIWRIKVLIEDTRVPFLRVNFIPLDLQSKFWSLFTQNFTKNLIKFSVDIVASNLIATYDCDILRYLIHLQDEAVSLFYFVRKWIKDLSNIKMKNMIIFYLVVFFLQRSKVLPTIRSVQSGVKKELIGGKN